MVKPFPSKTHIGNHMLHPETLMLNYGYDPQAHLAQFLLRAHIRDLTWCPEL
jgi:hypothetical protein